MNVGSISAACAVGGRNGVGVEAGEHAAAEREKRIKVTANRPALSKAEGDRLGEKYAFILIKKGRPIGSPQ